MFIIVIGAYPACKRAGHKPPPLVKVFHDEITIATAGHDITAKPQARVSDPFTLISGKIGDATGPFAFVTADLYVIQYDKTAAIRKQFSSPSKCQSAGAFDPLGPAPVTTIAASPKVYGELVDLANRAAAQDEWINVRLSGTEISITKDKLDGKEIVIQSQGRTMVVQEIDRLPP